MVLEVVASEMEQLNGNPEPVAADAPAEELKLQQKSQDTDGAVKIVSKYDKVVFPPPASWYKSSIAASRDEMWAYCSASVIVLVEPRNLYAKGIAEETTIPKNENGEGDANTEEENSNGAESITENMHKVKREGRWPTFTLIGPQLEKYNSISFCQSSWDYLPIPDSPLVSGCERGIVRVWNLKQKATVIYHDQHSGSQVMGVDWSPNDHSLIYSIDDKGSMSVWNVSKNSLRSMNFGKIIPTCLKASPHESNVVCFGTKGGNILIVDVTGTTGKILAKVRHEEEVVVVSWLPKGDWDALKLFRSEGRDKQSIVISNTHSMKLPSIRFWNKSGQDIGMIQTWEKDTKSRPFKMFGCAMWARDPNSGKLMLVSSGRHGEVISWSKDIDHEVIHKIHGHNAVFAVVQCGDILWSMSYEPVIIGFNLRTMEVECIIPAFKGTCTVAPSPVDSARLAIGGSDSVIRILKCVPGYPALGDGCTRAPITTHRLKGKVTAIAWHPTRDNCIGFGTDEGVLGLYELKESNKFAMMFDRRLSGTVYTVTFGPSVRHEGYVQPPQFESRLEDKEKDLKDQYMLYACGGSSVFMINPSKPGNPLINVSKIIEKSNPQRLEDNSEYNMYACDKASEISWAPDFSFFAIGFTDGRIELYTPPNLKMKCWIKCHLRAIQYLSWRPFDFSAEGLAENNQTRWLASTSNDGTTRLHNLGILFEEQTSQTTESETGGSSEPLVIISSEATLQGHGIRVISCAWSPHDKNLIVTVAYDCSAIVWNIATGEHIARYMEHQHRLVACCFHPTDPFKLITLSDEQSCDSSVHVWDYREHPFRKNIPKVQGCKPAVPIKAASETIKSAIVVGDDSSSNNAVPIKDHGENHSAAKDKFKHKSKPKSLLPRTANGLINSKCSLTGELRVIVDKTPFLSTSTDNQNQAAETEETPDIYLGLLGDAKDCLRQVEIERNGHQAKSFSDHAAILSTWMGDKGYIEKAIKNRQMTESMLPMAGFFSRQLYNEALSVLADQLVDNEEYVKASTYYFILGDSEKGVQILVDNALYREAIAYLKTNFPKDDPRTAVVMNKWANRAITDGNFELATKIYCSMGLYSNALTVIEKRAFPYAYQAGCYIASKLNDEKKLELYGAKFILDGILRKAYRECFDLIAEHPPLKWLQSIIKIHECLIGYSKYVAEIKNAKDFEMWTQVLKNLLEEAKDHMKLMEGEELQLEQKKISGNILVSIAQNEIDAQQIITKNLALLMIGMQDEEVATSKALEIVKLANIWFEKKNVPLYFSAIMATSFTIPAFNYPPNDQVPEKISSAQLCAITLVQESLNLYQNGVQGSDTQIQ